MAGHEPPRNDTGSPPRMADRQRDRRFLAVALILVAALFCGIVAGLMLAGRLVEGQAPPDLSQLEAMRDKLESGAAGSEQVEVVRAEDARLRAVYFSGRRRMAWGGGLLLVGAAALVVCTRWYGALDPRPPRPSDPVERANPESWLGTRRRREIGFAAGTAAVLVAAVALVVWGGAELPAGPSETVGAAPAETEPVPPEVPTVRPPTAEEIAANWPRLRGPGGMGVVAEGNWPREWDAESGLGIVWQSDVPMPGKSSPIIWGDRIFLSGADENNREIMCFRRSDGELLWRTPIPTALPPGEEVSVFQETGYAAPTPATDGLQVYALFATADLAAVDFEGHLVWSKNLGVPENAYGMASSPILYEGKLLVQFDRAEADDGMSALLAIDPATGETIWRTDRPVRQSWSTPLVINAPDGPELITCAAPWVIAYDPELGTELWRASGLMGDVAPCPVYDGKAVYVTTEYAAAMAIRPGGMGDVSETELVWKNEDAQLADAVSPVCDGRYFLQVHSVGTITCHDAETGEAVWEHDLGETIWASPTLVGDLVYLPLLNGRMLIFPLADRFEEAASGSLPGEVYATPAFLDGRLYFRTTERLYCVGSSE